MVWLVMAQVWLVKINKVDLDNNHKFKIRSLISLFGSIARSSDCEHVTCQMTRFGTLVYSAFAVLIYSHIVF